MNLQTALSKADHENKHIAIYDAIKRFRERGWIDVETEEKALSLRHNGAYLEAANLLRPMGLGYNLEVQAHDNGEYRVEAYPVTLSGDDNYLVTNIDFASRKGWVRNNVRGASIETTLILLFYIFHIDREMAVLKISPLIEDHVSRILLSREHSHRRFRDTCEKLLKRELLEIAAHLGLGVAKSWSNDRIIDVLDGHFTAELGLSA